MFGNNDALAERHHLYTLQDKKPVRCHNPADWLEWMKNTPLPSERVILHNRRVLVTSFAGYAGDRRESQPLTFATVFKPEPELPDFCITLEWYLTWDEAKAGHARYAQRFTELATNPSGHNAQRSAPQSR